MRNRIEMLTTILMITVILLAGCNGDKQKQPEQIEVPTDTQIEITLSEKAQAETVPTTLYPPENPYADLTVTGTAPTSNFLGGIRQPDFLWIPEFEYGWEEEDTSAEFNNRVPIAPDHAEKWTRYEKRQKELWYELGVEVEDVKSQELVDDMLRETEFESVNIRAEIMTEGMTPLNAAKYLMAHNIRTEHLMAYAQQAVDENPDDFHTQLIWTRAQSYGSYGSYSTEDYVDAIYKKKKKMKEGYRRLLEIRPNSAYALYNLGRLTHSADAIPLLKKAYQYAPDVPVDHHRHLRKYILTELARRYYKWETDDAEAEKKTVETLKHLSKYEPTLAQQLIRHIQTEKNFGGYSRPQ